MSEFSRVELRARVREFLVEQREAGVFTSRCDAWQRMFSREFSRELGARGWIGMTVPQAYGGGGRTPLERFVVAEELLAAGAPVAAHWIAERQIAPALVKLGTDEQRHRFLPGIVRGELVFGLGMSEPNSGSDLASVRTRAKRVDGGWSLSGQKIWTSLAHEADHLLVLCRTGDGDRPHVGLSQVIVDCGATGVEIRQIPTLDGADHFCEVFFDDVFIPADDLLGSEGQGWVQVTGELANERGGPERYMSTFALLDAFVRDDRGDGEDGATAAIGELVAELAALRQLAWRVAGAMERGEEFAVDAALLKDAGTDFEQRSVEVLREVGAAYASEPVRDLYADAVTSSPSATLRGGASEILRGIVARELVAR
jgi:acyl-CoA dehydrogenase